MHAHTKGTGKRGHIVADTLLLIMSLGLRKLENTYCGHKMFLNKIRNIFYVRNKCCAREQTGKHLCRQQCVRNNVASFARALKTRRICLEIEQLKNGCSSPTSNEPITSFAWEKTYLIPIAENWINKENSKYTLVFLVCRLVTMSRDLVQI